MGSIHFFTLVWFLMLLQFLDPCFALPLCTDSRAPFTSNSSLDFCPYNGATCCNSAQDLLLKQKFESMNISDSSCASLLKSILCARCDPFSAQLFRIDYVPRQVPVLCNSTISSNSPQSKQEITNFCSQVWNTCLNISMFNSPFVTGLQRRVGAPNSSNITSLTDIWQSQTDFCDAFGGSSDNNSVCFDGNPVNLTSVETPTPPNGICLEKMGNGSYINMVAHPDGSNRAFFSNQQGKIWLATIPQQGSGDTIQTDQESPFLDLTDEVHFDTQLGMLGLAFHPKFLQNGRIFASFNCDKSTNPNCAGRCACNSDVNCDPSKLGSDNGAQPCQYQSVIAEYSVNGTASQPSSAKSARPLEIRRIFTMGLPFTSNHGGQILFGPKDGYLYFMMGDGGGMGDPLNFAQNKKSLLGKILRFDVDNIPSATDVNQLGLWGNYSIPNDNPYVQDKELEKEIWALGLRNPWRCSFDSLRPSYFVCADVGQDLYEEVDLITKDGNYGWRKYEGPFTYAAPESPVGNTSAEAISPIFPVMGYNHSEVNSNQGSASITGGYFYRSMTDPCINGRYLYADLYASSIWTGFENPINSGNFSSNKISFTCANDSPISCTFAPNSPLPALSYIFSFGEDNNNDVYLLTNSGVYRIVRPSRCKYTCAKEIVESPGSDSPPRSKGDVLQDRYTVSMAFISILCLLIVNFG
ncbi:HIPL1 protein-like isoform X1 [Primulina eburnea]|uniref:HIPL1 protein-like isoform X1 n=2 Tax=Primulina eburnea TaxID=1245227 RepID=UPI003C6C2513